MGCHVTDQAAAARSTDADADTDSDGDVVNDADPVNPAPAEITTLDWPTPRECGSPSFSCRVWTEAAPIRAATLAHPFLTELTNGTLDREVFLGYLAQDAFYLNAYARTMAAAATQARSPEDTVFWSSNARDAILVERELHASQVTDVDAVVPSPTTTGYTSYLLSLAAGGSYPVLATGVLPCFWVYEYVGTRVREQVLLRAGASADDPEAVAQALAGHPYGDWIGQYGDPAFRDATAAAIEVVDRLADEADVPTRARMREAFLTACRYEWMFWDAAYRREAWPV